MFFKIGKRCKIAIKKILCRISNDYSFWESVRHYYYIRTGAQLNYSHPNNINEKLMWLTRYWQNPLISQCADKYAMREYVRSLGLDSLLPPLLGVWDTPEDINFEDLPEQFVLKCNHGCGFNIICTDKQVLNIGDVKNQLHEWLQIDYGKSDYEIHYSKIKPLVICEEYLPPPH